MDRKTLIQKLRSETFDLLIIGGGATGAGIALDAATRGLKAALVERDDFSSGTSSRSTKLIHGGVRYLEQAVKKFDRDQFHLVRDALRERATLIRIAPHLSHPIPLLTPIYSWVGVPYFRAGLKIYDWLAGKQNLSPSRFVGRKEALRNFPMLKPKGLKGGVLYFDGQFNDARMNLSIVMSAIEKGVVALNHLEIDGLLKEGQKISGAHVLNRDNGEKYEVRAKVMINAAGPFVDRIRRLDDPQAKPMLKTSSGAHIVLNKTFSPPATGLLIPKTEDGRVLFLLPWLGHTLVGTTDQPAPVEDQPKPMEEDIQYILRHLKKYFNIPVHRSDVLSSWSGLRPLVSDPKAADTAKLSRDHVINISASGLLTIAGGKWTTYRKMAEDAVEQAIRYGKLSPRGPSATAKTSLYGARGFSKQLPQELMDRFSLDRDVAHHLALSYGGNAEKIACLAQEGYGARIAPSHPFLEAEVVYGVEEEFALSPMDVLGRRMRLTFLDAQAARGALPRVLELMGRLLDWNEARIHEEEKAFLDSLSSPSSKSNVLTNQKTA